MGSLCLSLAPTLRPSSLQVAAIRNKVKEASKCKSFESFEILARLVTFKSHVAQVLELVRAHLPQSNVPQLRGKLQELLAAAARGILSNKTASLQELMVFLHGLVDVGLKAEEQARTVARTDAGAAHSQHMRKVRADGQEAVEKSKETAASEMDKVTLQGLNLLAEMGLNILHTSLKKGELAARARQPEVLGLLDPLLPLLVRSLRSRHSPNVSYGLRCLSAMVLLPLPGLEAAAPEAGKATTELLKRCAKTTHPIAQDCFKVMAAMLRECGSYQPTTAQLRFLLNWSFTDIEDTEARGTAFALLRAIMGRKLVVPEIYDLMAGRVQEMLIRSQAANVRDLCAQSLLQFLLDYPLGEKRLQQHLEFLLNNMQGYEHESGRLSALEFMGTLIAKFPLPVVEERADLLLLPLVTRMAADQAKSCRAAAMDCIKALLRRVPSQHTDAALGYALKWLQQDQDSRLIRAAAQLLGLLVELQADKFGRRVPEVLAPTLLVLARRIEAGWEGEEGHLGGLDGEGNAGQAAAGSTVARTWQDVYSCLNLIEKMCQHCPKPLLQPGAHDEGQEDEDALSEEQTSAIVWETAGELLLYPHIWVRKAASRLLGRSLASPPAKSLLLASEETAGQLAMSFFRQLESTSADEDLAGQATRALVALAREMAVQGGEGAAALPPLKRPRDEQDNEEKDGSSSSDEDEEEEEGAKAVLTLHGLVRRMARLADDKSFTRRLQRLAALRWIAAVATALGREGLGGFLEIMCRPLYRISEGTSNPAPGAPAIPEDVKVLGEEVLELLRGIVGPEALLAAYNKAREHVKQQRTERKRKQAVEALLDPELRAKKKIRRAERKQQGKKRKLEEIKRARGAGLAVKNRRGGGGKRPGQQR